MIRIKYVNFNFTFEEVIFNNVNYTIRVNCFVTPSMPCLIMCTRSTKNSIRFIKSISTLTYISRSKHISKCQVNVQEMTIKKCLHKYNRLRIYVFPTLFNCDEHKYTRHDLLLTFVISIICFNWAGIQIPTLCALHQSKAAGRKDTASQTACNVNY